MNPTTPPATTDKSLHLFDISLIQKFGATAAPPQNASSNVVAPGGISNGVRNRTLTSIGGSLRQKGLSEGAILGALQAVNKSDCKTPLPDDEVENIAKSIGKYAPGKMLATTERQPVITRLEDVQAEEVDWLWGQRIPLGKLTLIEGDPDVGKSFLTMDITSTITLGTPLPGDTQKQNPAKVLLLTAEDGLADTIKPRLSASGADMTKVRHLTAIKDREGNEQHFSLKNDLSIVEKVLQEEGGYRLVIIDPLNAYMGSTDTHKDSDVRTVLTPLARLAERQDVAVLCVRHLTKSPRESAKYRGQGSIGFIGAARAAYLVGIHPQDRLKRVMACVKNNLALKPSSLAFEIVKQGNTAKVEWHGEVALEADDLLAHHSDTKSKIEEAEEFLMDFLRNGEQPQKSVEKAAKTAGIKEETLKRAKKNLGVISCKKGQGWNWELPTIKGFNQTIDPIYQSLFPEQVEAKKNGRNQGGHSQRERHDPLELSGMTPPDKAALPVNVDEQYDEYEAAGISVEPTDGSKPLCLSTFQNIMQKQNKESR